MSELRLNTVTDKDTDKGVNVDALYYQNTQLVRNLGTWQPGLVFENKTDYATHNDQAIVASDETTLPYTTQGNDPTNSPDAGNVVPFAEVTRSDVVLNVASISDLQAMDTSALVDGQQVKVKGYHAGMADGGGQFCWDSSRPKADHTGGTVIDPDKTFPDDWSLTDDVIAWFSPSSTGNGCWVRLDVSEIRWADFGLTQTSMSGTVFQHPFDSGLAAGVADYALPDYEVTLTSNVVVTVPESLKKAVSIRGRGRISFSYEWDWPAVRGERLFTITGNGVYPVHTELNLDGAGMGRYPDVWRVVTGICIHDAPNSEIRVTQSEMFGFGTRIYNSPGSNVYINSMNCDGQKTTTDPETGAYDNYGDALYISSPAITVQSPKIKTTNGGRGGIVFESFTEQFSGVVINPTIDGYDRNIHVEGDSNDGNVTIQGGRLLNGNHSIWNFSKGSVVVMGVDFQNTTQVSARVLSPEVVAYCSTFHGGGKTRTIGCMFRTNMHPISRRAIYASGDHLSDGDVFDSDCGDISMNNAERCAIINPKGNTAGSINAHKVKRLAISGGKWSGSIDLPGTHNFEIRNLTMGRVGEFCGRIYATNKKGGIISNVQFANPESYCIGNFRDGSVGPKPVFEDITATRITSASAARLLQHSPTSTGHLYRSSLPSYVRDRIEGTCTEIAPITS